MATVGSPSIEHPGYWWYRARGDLLRVVLEKYVGGPGRLLDVGSADGPSVGWLRDRGNRVALDVDPRGLGPGDVCASVTRLPFVDGAFEELEHCVNDTLVPEHRSRELCEPAPSADHGRLLARRG